MAYPTCAPARPPSVSSLAETASGKGRDILSKLSIQATDELDALREAYRAAACLSNLLLPFQKAPVDERPISAPELGALLSVLQSEFERRLQTVKATVALMQMQ